MPSLTSDSYLYQELLRRCLALLALEPDYIGIPDSRFNKRVSIQVGETHLLIRGKRRGDVDVSVHTPPDRPMFVLKHKVSVKRLDQPHVVEHYVLPILRKRMVLLDLADV